MRRLLLLAALALAGCGDIPQPFRHDEGETHRLARPKLDRGVTIRPVTGYGHADSLADALAKALDTLEIPALVRTGPAFGHVLEGTAEGGMVAWTLKSPDGTEATTLRQRLPDSPEPMRLKRLAAEAVAVLARPLLVDPDALPSRDPGSAAIDRPTARLVTLAGLPGDGDKVFNAAIRTALERAGIALTEDADHVVVGAVTVSPAGRLEDNVVVAWVVKRKDGSQVATIEQGGAVPRGRLNLPWGSLARDIAEGSAAGIAEAVRQSRAQMKKEQPGRRSGLEMPPAAMTPEPGKDDAEPAPTMFTEQGPADIRAQDSSEQQTQASTAAQPVAAAAPKPPSKAKPVKPAKPAKKVVKKAVPAKAKVKAVKGGRATTTAKTDPSSRVTRAQR